MITNRERNRESEGKETDTVQQERCNTTVVYKYKQTVWFQQGSICAYMYTTLMTTKWNK